MEREITNPKLQIPNKHQIQNYKLAKVFNFENWNLLLGICNFKTTTLALTFSLLIFLILPTQTHASSEMDLSMFVMDKETNQPFRRNSHFSLLLSTQKTLTVLFGKNHKR